jgi:hypothetical protein
MRHNYRNILDGCFQKGKFSTKNIILSQFVAICSSCDLLTLDICGALATKSELSGNSVSKKCIVGYKNEIPL